MTINPVGHDSETIINMTVMIITGQGIITGIIIITGITKEEIREMIIKEIITEMIVKTTEDKYVAAVKAVKDLTVATTGNKLIINAVITTIELDTTTKITITITTIITTEVKTMIDKIEDIMGEMKGKSSQIKIKIETIGGSTETEETEIP